MDLYEQFAHGDLEAFETLFRQFQGRVYGWIVRVVRDPGVAEDLTLDTFWRIYRAHARFDPQRSFAAWARRIAANVALDYLKSVRREEALPENISQDPLPDSSLRRDIQEKIERAFRQLPAKLRVVAILAILEERPYEEIGEELGISTGAVKSRVFRAVRQLRGRLKRWGVQP